MKDSNNGNEATLFNIHQIETLPVNRELLIVIQFSVRCDTVLHFIRNDWPEHVFGQLKTFHAKQYEISGGLFTMGYARHYSKMFTRELHRDHPGSSRMKLLSRSHLWWPGLDLDFEKLAKSCTACLSVQHLSCCSSSPMGVAFQTLATCAHRLRWPIHGLNVPIVDQWSFQVK